MDPFTEKLLERTRARRENLQKKMAERPTAANRQMVKRTREPLVETNSGTSEPVISEGPHPSSKPSPSKRRCSGENAQAAAGEENQEPAPTHSVVPTLLDPPTDRKPPMGPASVRSASSLEKTTVQSVVQSHPEQIKTLQSKPERMPGSVAPDPGSVAPDPLRNRDKEVVPAGPALQKKREEPEEVPTPAATGIKNRMQRLVQQRQYWDNQDITDADQNCALLSPMKHQVDIPPAAVPTLSSETRLGRKGRLANLAATISSWEDDLSHVNIQKDNQQKQPVTTCGLKSASKVAVGPQPCGADQVLSSQTASSKSISSTNQQSIYSPVKSSKVILPSPQKIDTPVAKPEVETVRELSSTASPQKSSEGTAYPSSPHKAGSSSVPPTSQSPLRNKAPSKGLALVSSPKKPDLPVKPAMSGPSVLKNRENFVTKDHSTPLQSKATPGAPAGVKSFLERFGERCQERSNHSSPAGGAAQAKTPSGTPSVTPNTRLVQERLGAAQAANTTTADLTQKQKMERESELAAIRNRLQKGKNMWKNEDEAVDIKKNIENEKLVEKRVECEIAKPQLHDDPTTLSVERSNTTTNLCSAVGNGLSVSPPISTSSPLRRIECSEKPSDRTPVEEEVAQEVEMNVDQSINSAVINELFDGVLEQSEDQHEEEDALNISSMSLLTPLVETVAAVVKSPEKRMMTSTPTNSFIVKSKTPDKSSKFQKVCMIRTGSSDSVEASDDDNKLLYSIDAYRSTRVKETERPSVKQVIVRKEDLSHKVEESGYSSVVNIKQKMKMLSNEMNLQQTVIHQASQALNCCTDEEHGKGSQVEAEAERLLLVATERRAAIKAALDSLKGEGPAGQKKGPVSSRKAEQDSGMSASRGSISLQELRLPLKADFVCSTANKPESASHYFFLMIRSGAENTVATPLASTRSALSGDALTFTTKFTMSDVSSSFEIDIEVYYLVQKRELLSDKRKKPSKSKAITPKRFLAITKSSQTPVMASPGGPNAVRTSNFTLVGSHKLTLSSVGKNKFPLEKIKFEGKETDLLSELFHNKVPFLCPLEGHIYLKMQCEVGSKVEERGFLSMFEDVSGFGAWHRRWCVLSGYCISYWTYPDDEKRKNPIGRINLANCTSKKVEPANREFCARPNTFELITVRPQREDDRETLVSQCNNTMCVTKNWLSADTKDERNLWMQKLNQILVDLRMWQPDACYRAM
ncbi:anillin [Lampris incognitus]|uniref:anillin n=1 Tax=Lampris incognitus TaxID=2546036 RepID=UPI0024B4E832|nr:anillin [Lampris incognitus]